MPAPAGITPEKWKCGGCPKKHPDVAHEYELSLKNRKAIIAYRRIRAVSGVCLSKRERRDAMLLKNMAIIDQIYRTYESTQAAEAMLAIMPTAGRPPAPMPGRPQIRTVRSR